MKLSKSLQLLIPLLLVLLAAGCGRRSDERVFVVTGIVQSPAADGQIVVAHDDIPGFMPAMTMPFRVDEPAVEELRPGDRVRFRFRVGDSASRATDFELLGRAAPSSPPAPATPAARLRPGSPMPAFTLVDQAGETVTDSRLRNHLTVLTFIFTRCPVPEFCPLLARRFAELQDVLAGDPQLAGAVRLWSITIDPAHDTPEVLRAYAAAQRADPARWSFLTGTPDELGQLRRAFALQAVPTESGFDHSLATALVRRDGTVAEIWRGNGWKTAEVLAALRAESR